MSISPQYSAQLGKANTLSIKHEQASKIISLLKEGIYSDGWGATVREIVANAIDANEAAGRGDVPIDIFLPTPESPTLIIRDYGLGMSDQFMEESYTSLGLSTKENNSSQIGQFGIGRVTPLCVADCYFIHTFIKGRKTIWSFSVQDGQDRLIKLSAVRTSELDGTAIVIPSEPTNKLISIIVDRIVKWFSWVPVRPQVYGVNVNWNFNGQPIYSSKDWAKPGGWLVTEGSGYREPMILVGGLPYTVDHSNKFGRILAFWPSCITPVVDPKAIELTTSREYLKYSDKTIKTLKKLEEQVANVIIPSIKIEFQKRIDCCKSLIEAIQVWKTTKQLGLGISDTFYKGIRIQETFLVDGDVHIYYSDTDRRHSKLPIKSSSIVGITPLTGGQIFINDTPSNYLVRLAPYRKDRLTVITPPQGCVLDMWIERNTVLQHLHVIRTSSLPYNATKRTRQSSPKTQVKVDNESCLALKWVFPSRRDGSIKWYSYTVEEPVECKGSGIYVVGHKGEVVEGMPNMVYEFHEDARQRFLSEIQRLIKRPIYIIPKGSVGSLSPAWEKVDQFLNKKYSDEKAKFAYLLRAADWLAGPPQREISIDYCCTLNREVYEVLTSSETLLHPRSPMRKYLERSREICKEILENEDALRVFSKLINPVQKEEYKEQELKDLWPISFYPLLNQIAKRSVIYGREFVEFIQEIDRLKLN